MKEGAYFHNRLCSKKTSLTRMSHSKGLFGYGSGYDSPLKPASIALAVNFWAFMVVPLEANLTFAAAALAPKLRSLKRGATDLT